MVVAQSAAAFFIWGCGVSLLKRPQDWRFVEILEEIFAGKCIFEGVKGKDFRGGIIFNKIRVEM